MNENTEVKAAIEPQVQKACDIATGAVAADPASSGYRIVGAKKDLNCKGRGPQWYRMVYRNGSWRYVSDNRLPAGSFRASDRRATVHGNVYFGEIIVGHDHAGPVDEAFLVCNIDDADTGDDVLLDLPTPSVRRDGKLSIELPDGRTLVLPNPRERG